MPAPKGKTTTWIAIGGGGLALYLGLKFFAGNKASSTPPGTISQTSTSSPGWSPGRQLGQLMGGGGGPGPGGGGGGGGGGGPGTIPNPGQLPTPQGPTPGMYNPGVNPFGLGIGHNPGDTLQLAGGGTAQPYTGPQYTGNPLTGGAPLGSISGYNDGSYPGINTAGVVVGPGQMQSYDLATGKPVGQPFFTPAAAGYITAVPFVSNNAQDANAYLLSHPNQGLSRTVDPHTGQYQIVQEVKNNTGGYG